MSDNTITITLSDNAIVEIAKLIATTTPTGTPINPLATNQSNGVLPTTKANQYQQEFIYTRFRQVILLILRKWYFLNSKRFILPFLRI